MEVRALSFLLSPHTATLFLFAHLPLEAPAVDLFFEQLFMVYFLVV